MVEADENDRRKLNYRLTEKGIDLAPVLLELLVWASRHEETEAPCAVIENMTQNREAVLAETRRRWAERDPTPLLPRFEGPHVEGEMRRKRRDQVNVVWDPQRLPS